MSKVDISIQFSRDTLLVRKLLASIYRDRMYSDRQRLLEQSCARALERHILSLTKES